VRCAWRPHADVTLRSIQIERPLEIRRARE
jgi:hypothetical protein